MTNATAVVFEGPKTFAIHELPIPHIEPDEMIVEVVLAGVDGSELHIFDGKLERINAKAPLVLGDEIIGRVSKIGTEAANTRGLVVGDLVAIEARWPCEENCRACAGGNYMICEHHRRTLMGRHGYASTPLVEAPGLWGGYATHVFVPKEALIAKVPEGLPLNTALYACSVLANGLRWAREAGASEGKTIVVIGPGPQGLACVIAASRAGARVVSVGLERDGARLDATRHAGASEIIAIPSGEKPDETAARIGAIVGDVDAVIEVAGPPAAKQLAFAVVSPLGTVVNVSVASPQVQEIDWMALLLKEITIKTPMSHPYTVAPALDLALEMYNDGFDVGQFVTHTFGLHEVEHAIAVAAYRTEETPIKVALDPSR